MRTIARVIVVLALAWSIAACVGPGASAPADPATAVPTIAGPGSSFEPGRPKPTVEIPPPVD